MKKDFNQPNGQRVDVIVHTLNMISTHPTLKIHVGCDSVVCGNETCFYFVIAYRYGRNGASFIYKKLCVPNLPTKLERLKKEVAITMEWIDFLEQNDILVDIVEFDLNSNPTEFSSTLVNAAKGWAEGIGYKVLVKPDSQIAVKAANFLCQ